MSELSATAAGALDTARSDAETVRVWYEQQLRPLLEQIAPERIPAFDADASRIKQYIEQSRETPTVCFLGNSGVGKSTLINAVVAGAQIVLPQGGIGPLTAQATSVAFAAAPQFIAQYMPAKKLHELRSAIELQLLPPVARNASRGAEEADPESGTGGDHDATDSTAENGIVAATAEGAASERIPTEKMQELVKQARLMVTGRPDGLSDPAYLVDGLRTALRMDTRSGTTLDEADLARVAIIRERLDVASSGEAFERRKDANDKAFAGELRDHAAGFLAPLIAQLHVRWPSSALADGLRLVDLPGLGIAQDQYREVTRKFMSEDARGVVLVVDHRGVTDASNELLKSSGFFRRLMYSGDLLPDDKTRTGSSDRAKLVIAITRADDIARDERRRRLDEGDEITWSEAFATTCEKLCENVRIQLRGLLLTVDGQQTELAMERSAMIQKVIDDTLVFAVSAPEYRDFITGESRRISDVSESNVPAFACCLENIARARRDYLERQLESEMFAFGARARSILEVLGMQWQEKARADEEAERLRADLETFLSPLRSELAVRNGAFLQYLRNQVPDAIETKTRLAASEARHEIVRYLRTLEGYNVRTLQAAVRREGVWVGSRNVNLPEEFIARFEEPIALVWSKHILADIRRQTQNLVTDYALLVEQVIGWAREQGARVQPRLVEVLRDQMLADMRSLAQIGRDAVDELRKRVRQQLEAKISKPIQRECQRMVRLHLAEGRGARDRIIECFNALAPAVEKEAIAPAVDVLKTNFREVSIEINAAFEKYKNPLDQAADVIVTRHRDNVRRADERRRESVVRTIQGALDTLPDRASGVRGQRDTVPFEASA